MDVSFNYYGLNVNLQIHFKGKFIFIRKLIVQEIDTSFHKMNKTFFPPQSSVAHDNESYHMDSRD